jgi:hypothetical protein
VEHVHVYQGGQAIVGAVAPSGPGRGVGDDTEDDKAPHEKRRSWLKRGNPPGDFSKAPRCGAKTRRGTHCQCLGMPNGSPRATHRRSYAGTWWSLQRRPAPEERQTVLFRTARSGQGRAPFRRGEPRNGTLRSYPKGIIDKSAWPWHTPGRNNFSSGADNPRAESPHRTLAPSGFW